MKQPLTLHSDCLRFLAYLRTIRHYSPHTIRNYHSDLRSLSGLLDNLPYADITPHHIRKLASQLHSVDLSARTIARHLACWRSFFNWAVEFQHTATNPVDNIKAPKRGKSLPKALSVDEAVHLVEHAPQRHIGKQNSDTTVADAAQAADHAMFELLYSSGLRVSELTSLDIRYHREPSLNGIPGYCSISWLDLHEQLVHVTGKGNKTREVPVGSAAINALKHWLSYRPLLEKTDTNALFLSSRGTRISVRLVQLRLHAHALQSGAKGRVHPHVLRHSFASHLLQSSGDLRAVQELLGHASIASTQIYTALDFQHLSTTYDASHPRAKRK